MRRLRLFRDVVCKKYPLKCKKKFIFYNVLLLLYNYTGPICMMYSLLFMDKGVVILIGTTL